MQQAASWTFPFLMIRRDAAVSNLRQQELTQTKWPSGIGGPASPAVTAPVAVPSPVAAMPTVPAPVTPVPVPVPVMAPAHLLGLEVIDIVLRDHGGFSGIAARRREMVLRRNRRQRCSLRARSKHCSARGYSKGEFQKVAAFHAVSSAQP
jgi:hypothetical protein